MTAMRSAGDSMTVAAPETALLPRFDDGMVNIQEPVRTLAEVPADQIMDAESDRLCEGGANGGSGCRERRLATCVGEIATRIPKLRTGSFFPEDIVELYQRVDRTGMRTISWTG